jgi:hypothetical protein
MPYDGYKRVAIPSEWPPPSRNARALGVIGDVVMTNEQSRTGRYWFANIELLPNVPGQPKMKLRMLRTLPPTHELIGGWLLTAYAIWKALRS